MSRIDTLVCTDARKTKYRFVVLTMIFLVYAINYADRTNIGAVLPFIIDEFHINNFEAGAIASMFFLGYAISQIPAGFFIARRGTRGLVSLSIFGFSAFTWLMGTVSSVFGLKLVRLGLGLAVGLFLLCHSRDRGGDSVVPVGQVKARGERICISKRTGRD